jgi:hypothetical protein
MIETITSFLQNNVPNYVLSYIGMYSFKSVFLFIGLPVIWYSLGLVSAISIRKYMYNAGYYISHTCKKVPYWDKYVEPIFIRQFVIVFTASHSLIEGMVSDNENSEEVKQELEEMKDGIFEELEAFNNSPDDKIGDIKKEEIKQKIDNKIENIMFKISYGKNKNK